MTSCARPSRTASATSRLRHPRRGGRHVHRLQQRIAPRSSRAPRTAPTPRPTSSAQRLRPRHLRHGGQPNADIIDLGLRRSQLERHPDRPGRGVRGHGRHPGHSIRQRRRHHGRQRHRDRRRHGAHLDGRVREVVSPRRPSTGGSRSAAPAAPSTSRSTRRRRMTATSHSAAARTPTSRTAWAERRRGSRATAGATNCSSNSVAMAGCAPT